MNSLKSFISKKVVSLGEGKLIGYVLNVCLDQKLNNLIGFIIVDEESEEEKFLSFKNLKSYNENYLFVESVFDIENFFDSNNSSPIGKLVFTNYGDELGLVEDVIIDKNKVQKIITNKSEILIKNIIKNGDDFLIFSKKNNIKKNNFNFKENKTENIPKIKIQENVSQKIKINENINKSNNMFDLPIRAYTSTSLLLNKIALCDIIGFNNEIIIKKNEIITKKIIEKAKIHNKLNFLIFNCK